MNVHRLAATVVAQAPAKLNLYFEILGKRDDGYHEVETLMVPIDLCDTLFAHAADPGQFSLDCRWALPTGQLPPGQLPCAEQNLALRAARLLAERSGTVQGISLELIKRIPSAAGLGGGSSDAAAALVAANELWNLHWDRRALAKLAAELGSDVPFFLGRGAAVCRGRGEMIEPLAARAPLHVVVVRPPEGLSTAAVYGRVQPVEHPRSLGSLVDALGRGDLRRVASSIFNRLEAAAETLSPWIGRVAREFSAEDCLAAQMSGSGSAYFGICRHARHARRVARRLQSRDIGRVYAVSTSN
jgi:4-diphosphocytidyl-2-C-methyl-D-erythritol kinase